MPDVQVTGLCLEYAFADRSCVNGVPRFFYQLEVTEILLEVT